MLITFETEPQPPITMFSDVAVTLIKMMGHSGTVPSALLAEDVPTALARLKAAVAVQANEPLDPPGGASWDHAMQSSLGSCQHAARPDHSAPWPLGLWPCNGGVLG